jgi:SpoVK/Ycf46/Vps4 family AAA+-type ATPase
MKEFSPYLKAGYPVLWVQTHEETRATRVLAESAPGYHVYCWDLVNGLRDGQTGQITKMGDPLKPLQQVTTLPEESILFLKDYHKFIGSIEVFRTIKNLIPVLKATDRHLVIVSPIVAIPAELEKDITVLNFPLPTVEELVTLARKIATENELTIEIDEATISSARGLTLAEAENALAKSLVETKTYSKRVLENEKLQAIKKSGLMELLTPRPESELGGLDALKQYIKNRKQGFTNPALPCPRGILLIGPPGTGKSLTAQVVASVLDYPLISLDMGALKGSLVGESERKMREALSLIDAVSPCVVRIDEIEKAIGGVQSSARTDGGTTSAMFGYFLTWLQESQGKHFVIATCNDVDDLLTISQGALLRRFDDVFFLDLPNDAERRDILKIMNARYSAEIPLYATQTMAGWTGAEIEKFVIASIYDGHAEAHRNMKPISIQNAGTIERAREWARNNARPATMPETETPGTRRVKAERSVL